MIDLATALRQHRNYDPNDLAHLRRKGWSDRQIFDRWSEEAERGHSACRFGAPTERARLAATSHLRTGSRA